MSVDAPENKKAAYVVNTYFDGSATLLSQIWADSDLDSKRTMNGCESSNPTFLPIRLVSSKQQVYLNT